MISFGSMSKPFGVTQLSWRMCSVAEGAHGWVPGFLYDIRGNWRSWIFMVQFPTGVPGHYQTKWSGLYIFRLRPLSVELFSWAKMGYAEPIDV